MSLNVVVHSVRRVLDMFFKVDEALISYDRFGGRGRFENVRRLVFERGDSVAALVYDRETGEVLLTRQFRYPTFEKTPPGVILETPAGSIDGGESPEAALRREIREELGYELGDVEHISTFYVSPGGTSERIILFYAPVTRAQLVDADAFGKEGEHEDIEHVRMKLPKFIAACESGAIADAKTVIAGLWAKTKRRSALFKRPA